MKQIMNLWKKARKAEDNMINKILGNTLKKKCIRIVIIIIIYIIGSMIMSDSEKMVNEKKVITTNAKDAFSNAHLGRVDIVTASLNSNKITFTFVEVKNNNNDNPHTSWYSYDDDSHEFHAEELLKGITETDDIQKAVETMLNNNGAVQVMSVSSNSDIDVSSEVSNLDIDINN